MKEWHYNVLFFVGVGGAVLLLIGPETWVNQNPTAITGVGTILAYVLRRKITNNAKKESKDQKDKPDKEEEEVL